jgi:hypothetical protein
MLLLQLRLCNKHLVRLMLISLMELEEYLGKMRTIIINKLFKIITLIDKGDLQVLQDRFLLTLKILNLAKINKCLNMPKIDKYPNLLKIIKWMSRRISRVQTVSLSNKAIQAQVFSQDLVLRVLWSKLWTLSDQSEENLKAQYQTAKQVHSKDIYTVLRMNRWISLHRHKLKSLQMTMIHQIHQILPLRKIRIVWHEILPKFWTQKVQITHKKLNLITRCKQLINSQEAHSLKVN